MNKTFENLGKQKIKELIQHCTPEQQELFKKCCTPKYLELTLGEIIDQLDPERINWAINIIERTLAKNAKEVKP